MRKSRKNISGFSLKPPLDQSSNLASARLPSDYSPPNLRVVGVTETTISQFEIDYQLTVRPKVELSRYRISMLLEIITYEAVEYGLGFTTWLTLEWLFSRLIGSHRVWEIRESNERRVLLAAELVLLTSQNLWLSLNTRENIPEEIRMYLFEHNLLASKRTIASRREFWQPEKFLEVRAVRLDVFLEREKDSTRYSSYTKGYGESSRMGRRQKTRNSAELDGEDNERPEVLIGLSEIQNLLYLNLIEIRRKFRRKA